MDPTTIIGIASALGLILWSAASATSIAAYFDLPSAAIVLGGTLCIVIARSSFSDFIGSLQAAFKMFVSPPMRPELTVEQLVEFATIARRDGITALDSQDVADPFFTRGLHLLVDGADDYKLGVILHRDIEKSEARLSAYVDVWQTWVDVGPSMGMVGTLVGLVAMLGNMTDPKSIGPAMAVAILTTLYGAIVANVIGLPIVTKLRSSSIIELQNQLVVVEGLQAIARGENGRHVRDYLTPMIWSPSSLPADEIAT